MCLTPWLMGRVRVRRAWQARAGDAAVDALRSVSPAPLQTARISALARAAFRNDKCKHCNRRALRGHTGAGEVYHKAQKRHASAVRARPQASPAGRSSMPRPTTPPSPAAPSAPSTTRSARSADLTSRRVSGPRGRSADAPPPALSLHRSVFSRLPLPAHLSTLPACPHPHDDPPLRSSNVRPAAPREADPQMARARDAVTQRARDAAHGKWRLSRD
jgi:hypothetical protein